MDFCGFFPVPKNLPKRAHNTNFLQYKGMRIGKIFFKTNTSGFASSLYGLFPSQNRRLVVLMYRLKKKQFVFEKVACLHLNLKL